jgi:hypothetical protein
MHNKELHNLYASLNIIRIITSRSMRMAGHVECKGHMRITYTIQSFDDDISEYRKQQNAC